MLRLKYLKAGDVIQVNDYPNTAFAVVHLSKFKTILACSKDDPKRIPKDAAITFLGEVKIIQTNKTEKKFYGCFYNEEMIYISEYFMKDFTKIKC